MTRLRPATARDVPAMADILQDWLDATPWMPDLHSRAGTRAFLGRLRETTEITVAGEAAIEGFLSLDGEEVEALYLATKARGMGVGAALIAAAQAARPRLSLWTFRANAGARRFYARNGFREVEATDGAGNEEKLPDVRLEWSRT